MEINLSVTGKKEGSSVELSDVAFGREFNEALVHQVVVAYMAGARAGTRAQKNRSDVSGGGAKPWRQKEQVALEREPSVVQSGVLVE